MGKLNFYKYLILRFYPILKNVMNMKNMFLQYTVLEEMDTESICCNSERLIAQYSGDMTRAHILSCRINKSWTRGRTKKRVAG